MSRNPAPPPLVERDGSKARAEADDGDEWREVKAATSHPNPPHSYWFPPEVTYLVAEGMDWQRLEAVLRPALAVRAAAAAPRRGRPPRPPEEHSAAPRTIATAGAVAAYFARYPETHGSALGIAKRIRDHGERRYQDWHLLDPDSHVMRDIIEATLRNRDQDQQ